MTTVFSWPEKNQLISVPIWNLKPVNFDSKQWRSWSQRALIATATLFGGRKWRAVTLARTDWVRIPLQHYGSVSCLSKQTKQIVFKPPTTSSASPRTSSRALILENLVQGPCIGQGWAVCTCLQLWVCAFRLSLLDLVTPALLFRIHSGWRRLWRLDG